MNTNTDLIPTHGKVPLPLNVKSTKHSKYHYNYWHTIDECDALKDKIEELIQEGHLWHFVRGYEKEGHVVVGGMVNTIWKAEIKEGKTTTRSILRSLLLR